MFFICTPINLDRPSTENGKKARQDYLREQPFFTEEGGSKWDDSSANNAQVGDMFSFVHQTRDRMEVFRIVRIVPYTERPDYWDIPEHQRRNVVYLSQKLEERVWSFFKEEAGYGERFSLRGTQRLKKN